MLMELLKNLPGVERRNTRGGKRWQVGQACLIGPRGAPRTTNGFRNVKVGTIAKMVTLNNSVAAR
jgi:hypothetical protein